MTAENIIERRAKSRPPLPLRIDEVVLDSSIQDQRISSVANRTQEIMATSDLNEREAINAAMSEALLGQSLAATMSEASELLHPYKNGTANRRPYLFISSASTASGSWESEASYHNSHGGVIDIPGAIEGRDGNGGSEGDIATFSTNAGWELSQSLPDGITSINLAHEPIVQKSDGTKITGADIYYKADVITLLALTNPECDGIRSIITALQSETTPVLYPYNIDTESQIALVWLARQAEVERLDVYANSPEIAVNLTSKGYKYPTVKDALTVDYYDDPYEMQRAEWKKSQQARELNTQLDHSPGYEVRHSGDREEFNTEALTALMLHSARYEFDDVYIKPTHGTDGGNQMRLKMGSLNSDTASTINQLISSGNVDHALDEYRNALRNVATLETIQETIDVMWKTQGDWVIEASTHYFELPIDIEVNNHSVNYTIRSNPSVHIVNGVVQDVVSLQLNDGVTWGGNGPLNKADWDIYIDRVAQSGDPRLQDPYMIQSAKDAYQHMITMMRTRTEAVNSSEKYIDGQVRGGVDCAVATLGGKFNHEKVLVIAQDDNPRPNGAESAHNLRTEALKINDGNSAVVTRNFSPLQPFNVLREGINQAAKSLNQKYGTTISRNQLKIIASSAGWGQMGFRGPNTFDAINTLYLLEDEMRQMGYIN